MKLFIMFSILVTAAALRTPLIGGPMPRWLLLAEDQGARYWFFPMLALLWCLLWAASQNQLPLLRIFGVACFMVMLRAIWHDWHYRPYSDKNFGSYLRQFDAAAQGTEVLIPTYAEGTQMRLIKK